MNKEQETKTDTVNDGASRSSPAPCSALGDLPEMAQEALKMIIKKPQFLKRLFLEEATRCETYAAHPASQTPLSGNVDAWGNYVSVADDCLGKAKFYRRAAESLSLLNAERR